MICHPKQIKIGTAELELNWQATGIACNTLKKIFFLVGFSYDLYEKNT